MIVVHGVSSAPAHRALNRRTVARIQEKIIEKHGRNLVSRLANAKNDKETIAAWRLDLNRILHIFNVRPAIAGWPLLTAHSQTELAINTRLAVSDVHHGVVNTHTMVSAIHRNMLKSQEGTDDQLQLVSDIRTLSHHRISNVRHHLDASQVRDLDYDRPNILYSHLVHLENHHRHHRETSLDETS